MTEQPTFAERPCSWCGAPVAAGDGYRLLERPGARRATFCRLEHLVPWALRGPSWEPEPHSDYPDDAPADCSQCCASLGDVRVALVRHRGEARIPDAFCSVDHASEWAKAGGRYR